MRRRTAIQLYLILLLILCAGCSNSSTSAAADGTQNSNDTATSGLVDTTTPAPDQQSSGTDQILSVQDSKSPQDGAPVFDVAPVQDLGTSNPDLGISVPDLATSPDDTQQTGSPCGNGSCDEGESCANCPKDCGASLLTDFGADLCSAFVDIGKCEDVKLSDGTTQPVPGATSSFFGYFQFKGGTDEVSGLEYWVLLPNKRWQELGAKQCQIVWTLSGIKKQAPSCLQCDYAVSVNGALNNFMTTCPKALVDTVDLTFKVTYEIKVSTGESQVFFTSGKQLGSGSGSDNQMTYQSLARCVWF